MIEVNAPTNEGPYVLSLETPNSSHYINILSELKRVTALKQLLDKSIVMVLFTPAFLLPLLFIVLLLALVLRFDKRSSQSIN